MSLLRNFSTSSRNGNPRVIEVQEVRAFGVLLLHVLPVRALHEHDIPFDFSVRMVRSTRVPPALACELYVFVDREFASHENPSFLNTECEEFLGNVLGR